MDKKIVSSILSFYFVSLFVSASEVKEHAFFNGTDWQLVYLQKFTPPIIPPRGEVNAADAFDIGSFDEEDTKGIKVCGLFSASCHMKICFHSICLRLV